LVRLVTSKIFLAKHYPVKVHAGAANKVNISLPDLMSTLVRMGYTGAVTGVVNLTAGSITEDQMINLLLYGFTLVHTLGQAAWDIATHFILNPGVAKNVSVALKALGANTSRFGAALVECDVLQGRGAGVLDLTAEARYRCDITSVNTKVIPYSDELRSHIRAIISAELRGRTCELPDLDTWWTSRWLWCVNGSQTTLASHGLGIDHKMWSHSHDRVYRRMAAEALDREPLTSWSGRTTVSQSIKLENGKQRAIFACDTASYFAFSWILGAVEKIWRDDRVILNPGAGGHLGITKRVRNAQRGGGVNLMLDYDDFNSHHATETMQAVFDELCAAFNAPHWYREKLKTSFTDMHMMIDGVDMTVAGTLMSGHRGTTFINSVLNAAYIRYAVGGDTFDAMTSLHAGDDVYVRANTLTDCEAILNSASQIGCRMNPTKQSIGYVGAEFLRVAISHDAAYGYLARGISGLVSGNWVTQDVLAPQDALVSAVASVRTLINRSGCVTLPRLLAGCLRYTRGVGKRLLTQLLSGSVALDGQPVFNADYVIKTCKLKAVTPDRVPVSDSWATHASRDYLTAHTSDVERAAMELVGSNALSLLVASSYSKGLNQDFRSLVAAPTLSHVRSRPAVGFISAAVLLERPPDPGILTPYPLVRLYESILSTEDIRTLVLLAGGDPWAPRIREVAFGPVGVTRNIIGALPFGDAANLSRRARVDNIFTLYNVYT